MSADVELYEQLRRERSARVRGGLAEVGFVVLCGLVFWGGAVVLAP